jgi:hypothetical protein
VLERLVGPRTKCGECHRSCFVEGCYYIVFYYQGDLVDVADDAYDVHACSASCAETLASRTRDKAGVLCDQHVIMPPGLL